MLLNILFRKLPFSQIDRQTTFLSIKVGSNQWQNLGFILFRFVKSLRNRIKGKFSQRRLQFNVEEIHHCENSLLNCFWSGHPSETYRNRSLQNKK